MMVMLADEVPKTVRNPENRVRRRRSEPMRTGGSRPGAREPAGEEDRPPPRVEPKVESAIRRHLKTGNGILKVARKCAAVAAPCSGSSERWSNNRRWRRAAFFHPPAGYRVVAHYRVLPSAPRARSAQRSVSAYRPRRPANPRCGIRLPWEPGSSSRRSLRSPPDRCKDGRAMPWFEMD
jgi:hypothetical protein